VKIISLLSISNDSTAKKKHIPKRCSQCVAAREKTIPSCMEANENKLRKFKDNYQMSSDQFFKLYQAGKDD